MPLNENLQNVVNDLKEAKSTIASALSNINEINANSGLGTIAKQISGKTSIYDTSNAASGNESKVLDGITFYDQLGSQTGTMLQYTHSAPNIQYSSSTKKISAVNYDSTKSGYFPSVGNTARYSEISPADLEPNKNLKAENIKSGISIFGVDGTMPSGYAIVSGSITTNQTSTLLSINNLPFTSIAGFNFHYMGTGTPASVTISGNQVFSFQLYSSYVYFITYAYSEIVNQYVATGDTIPLASAYRYSNGTLILSTQWVVNNYQTNLNFGPQTYNYTIIGN